MRLQEGDVGPSWAALTSKLGGIQPELLRVGKEVSARGLCLYMQTCNLKVDPGGGGVCVP